MNSTERLEHLDILRGAAIFGILLVNMMYYAHPYIYYQIVGDIPWDSTLDRITGYAIYFFGEGKFISMFAMLFGIGVVIQMDRAKTKGAKFFPVYFRRLTVLLIIGAVHAFLIWMGDILLAYALMGFIILFFFRNRKPKTLIVWTVISLLIPFIIFGLMTLAVSSLDTDSVDSTESIEESIPSELQWFNDLIERSIEAYGTGNVNDILVMRVIDISLYFIFGIFWMPAAFALMLFGIAIAKRNIAQQIDNHQSLLNKILLWGFILGIAGNAIALTGFIKSDPVESNYWELAMYLGRAIGAPSLMLFYAAGITQLYRYGWFPRFFIRLAAVGRMALTNYILQSIICTMLFYSYGLGLYGSVGPFAGLLITVAIFIIQLFISPLWMKRFHFGPLEWLWRSGTYMKIQRFSK